MARIHQLELSKNELSGQMDEMVAVSRTVRQALVDVQNNATQKSEELNVVKRDFDSFDNLLQEFQVEADQQSSVISAQLLLNNQQQAVIAQLGTDLQNLPNAFGVTYVRWGRTVCPSTAHLVYEGYAGKSAYNQGGGDNYQCLVKDPWSPTGYQAGHQAQSYMYGVEYSFQSGNVWDSVAHDADVPCAVCQVIRRTRILMIPGKPTCPAGWTREYFGVLAAERYNHHSGSTFECVDINPEEVPGSRGNTDGGIMYPVEAYCGALKCPPYVEGYEISCAECTA